MSTFSEGNLEITFPPNARVMKFDDATHGLSHCMKAVDFIVELEDKYLFIELKDPQHPESQARDRNAWIEKFCAGTIVEDFKYKFRDSFLYQWASRCVDKPIHYYVLVALDTLSEADLLTRTDELKRQLPLDGPRTNKWTRTMVNHCMVFNMATWNRLLPTYPVKRCDE